MDCDAFLDKIADYADGTLGAPALRDLIAHAASCPACATLLESDDAFVSRLQRVTDVEMPDEAKTRLRRLLARIRNPRR